MAKNDNLTDYLTGLADKLRGLLGQTERMNPQSFEEKIQEVYDRGFASGGPDAESITATAEQVVSGKTFGAGGQEVRTGTMPLRATGQAANSCVLRDETLYYRLPHGCWPNTYSDTECEAGMGQAAVAEAIGLTAEKLMEGNTILGIAGNAGKAGDLSIGYAYYYSDDVLHQNINGDLFGLDSQGYLYLKKAVAGKEFVFISDGGDAAERTRTIQIGGVNIVQTVGTRGTMKTATVTASAGARIHVAETGGNFNGGIFVLVYA